jgi:RNA polymerase sigma factor (TIGR02999 family)
MGDVTALIAGAHSGDAVASAQLFAQVYDELKRMARQQVRRLPTAGMQATTLVHEAYFRLARPESLDLTDRAHFYAVAARAMRQLLIDSARARHAAKRGDGDPLPLDCLGAEALSVRNDDEVFALEQAMDQLQALDPALASLVELRFHAGLELTEIAELNGRSERSLKRDWRKARAFLHAQLAQADDVPVHG